MYISLVLSVNNNGNVSINIIYVLFNYKTIQL